jgi:hypothetical protein
MPDCITEGGTILGNTWNLDFTSKHVSRELVQLFIKILFMKNMDPFFSMISRYFTMSVGMTEDKTPQLFSMSLNLSFLRLLCCGTTPVTAAAAEAYCSVIDKLSVEQKRQIVDSGAWTVLTTLLHNANETVVISIDGAMMHLVKNRNGEDYARFVEEDLFDRLIKHLRSQSSAVPGVLIAVTGAFPLPACCTPLLAEVSHEIHTKHWETTDVLTLLASLARSRGVSSHFLSFTSCHILGRV